MDRDEHWAKLLASLVRRVGSAMVDQLEDEVRTQFITQLERPRLHERRQAVQHIRRTLIGQVPQLPRSEKDALEPLLRRALELADSTSFLEGLIRTLDAHDFTALERLVLLNRLTPDSMIEIHLFDEPQQTETRPALALVPEPASREE